MIALPKNPYPPLELAKFIYKIFHPQYGSDLDANNGQQHWQISKTPLTPTATIGFVGDILPVRKRKMQFDPAIIEFFSDCDYLIGNFEGIISDQPAFFFIQKHSTAILDQLATIKPLNQWYLSLANNHAMDFGVEGFNNTKRFIQERGANVFGDKENPSINLPQNIVIDTWTQWVNGKTDLVEQSPRLATGLSPSMQDKTLHIAYPHWGYEFESMPRVEQLVNIPLHYDLIVGHHPHFVQPIQRTPDSLIAWSLGNFTTEIKRKLMHEGRLLKSLIGLNSAGLPRIDWVKSKNIRLEVEKTTVHSKPL